MEGFVEDLATGCSRIDRGEDAHIGIEIAKLVSRECYLANWGDPTGRSDIVDYYGACCNMAYYYRVRSARYTHPCRVCRMCLNNVSALSILGESISNVVGD